MAHRRGREVELKADPGFADQAFAIMEIAEVWNHVRALAVKFNNARGPRRDTFFLLLMEQLVLNAVVTVEWAMRELTTAGLADHPLARFVARFADAIRVLLGRIRDACKLWRDQATEASHLGIARPRPRGLVMAA